MPPGVENRSRGADVDAGNAGPHTVGPHTVGPYTVRSKIGSGGMAEVYAAIDPRRVGLHRLVALKRLRPHLVDREEHLESFAEEARIASRVHHPNVCQVVDFGLHGGQPYLVMEHLCGANLEHLRHHLGPDGDHRERRVALIAEIIASACEGLHALHELRGPDGLPLDAVHRDISPDNLFVTCAGLVKICDLGIVKANRRRRATTPGTVKGKLAYIAPEALDGEELDRRADVWAVGVVAWELLTGLRLFRRRTEGETISALADRAIERPDTIASDVPAPVADVIMFALRRDRDQRFRTTRAFGRALRKAAESSRHRLEPGELQSWLNDATDHEPTCVQRLEDIDLDAFEGPAPAPSLWRRRSFRLALVSVVGIAAAVGGHLTHRPAGVAAAEAAIAPRVALPIRAPQISVDEPMVAPTIEREAAEEPVVVAPPPRVVLEQARRPARPDYGF